MELRQLLKELEADGTLTRIKREVDPHLEIANIISALNESPVLFDKVKGSDFPLFAGIVSSRETISRGTGTTKEKLLFRLAKALRSPKKPKVVKKPPCQENVTKDVDLSKFPLLYHLKGDGGRYTTATVAIINDPDTGPNACYHRLMQIGKKTATGRLIEHRQTWNTYHKVKDDLPVSICIGNKTAVLVAASISPAPGVDELSIANALEETPVAKCITNDLLVPANSEIVLEGRITKERNREGPFVDLTGTRDYERQEPVFVIDMITHRNNALYQAILAGGVEHQLLMGMPREPTIYDEVSKVCTCKNVLMTKGGGSWLHTIVQIIKKKEDDGKKAIEKAFVGHKSLKNVLVVDDDIDIYDMDAVEKAIATRFQPDKDVVILSNQTGSSLDPSAKHEKGKKTITSKMGLDATLPLNADRSKYEVVKYGKVKLDIEEDYR